MHAINLEFMGISRDAGLGTITISKMIKIIHI